MTLQDELDMQRRLGQEEGREEGERRRAVFIAVKLLSKGIAMAEVAELTGLSEVEIRELMVKDICV
jgi:predicted transposase/invertase (TIGR01784 family)